MFTLDPYNGCGGLVAESRFQGRRVASSRSDSPGRKPPCIQVCLSLNPLRVKRFASGVMRKFGEDLAAQMSSLSSGHGLKLPRLNSHVEAHHKISVV
ncbi:hypothetical protein AVEN_201889-1 [Araneus ventricosus]|uniref:Uncharacterized protein n=1 Tax=Araneus ventricosus TaxID=182803 RepID=A0A4Y2G7Q7_ARAVE|nr:hypothetical protein AVEN_201889-1 [Araneus ventricosus]